MEGRRGGERQTRRTRRTATDYENAKKERSATQSSVSFSLGTKMKDSLSRSYIVSNTACGAALEQDPGGRM